MRIAVYHNQHAGGAARVIESYLHWSAGRHHIELFAPTTADTGFVDLEEYAQKVHRVNIPGSDTPIGRYQRVLAVTQYGREIAEKIDAGNYDAVFANLSFVTQAPEILPYLKTPSLYYCPEPLRSVYDKAPFSEPHTPKGIMKQIFFKPFDFSRKLFDKKAIKRATKVVTHSYFTQRVLNNIYGVNAEVVHLGVDTELFKPLKLPRKNEVISVGAIHPLKGHQFVVEALATISQKKRPKLVVIGPRGDFGGPLEQYAKMKGVTLEIKTAVPTDDIVKAYNQAKVMAAAQYNEPFGLITLEAMACGTPVVAVAEGGLQETVASGQTGLLTERNPVQFASEIIRVLENPELAARLKKNGRADVEENWQWSKSAAKIDELLGDITTTTGVESRTTPSVKKSPGFVSVVIPNWNGRNFLPMALNSLTKQKRKADEIIIVDNGSTDGSVEYIRRNWPKVVLVALSYNHGFAEAVNRGIAAARGQYVALLNNDLELDPAWTGEMVAALKAHPEAASASCKMLQYKDRNRIDEVWNEVSWFGTTAPKGRNEHDRGQYDEPRDVFSACAGAAVYRRDAFSKIGLFDADFFAYQEDVDWGFRAQLAGWTCRYVPTARVYHVGGATSDRLSNFALRFSVRNNNFLVLKNFPLRQLLISLPKLGFGQAKTLYGALKGRWLQVYMDAWWQTIWAVPAVLRKRRQVQQSRSISRKHLNSIVLGRFPLPSKLLGRRGSGEDV